MQTWGTLSPSRPCYPPSTMLCLSLFTSELLILWLTHKELKPELSALTINEKQEGWINRGELKYRLEERLKYFAA